MQIQNAVTNPSPVPLSSLMSGDAWSESDTPDQDVYIVTEIRARQSFTSLLVTTGVLKEHDPSIDVYRVTSFEVFS